VKITLYPYDYSRHTPAEQMAKVMSAWMNGKKKARLRKDE